MCVLKDSGGGQWATVPPRVCVLTDACMCRCGRGQGAEEPTFVAWSFLTAEMVAVIKALVGAAAAEPVTGVTRTNTVGMVLLHVPGSYVAVKRRHCCASIDR